MLNRLKVDGCQIAFKLRLIFLKEQIQIYFRKQKNNNQIVKQSTKMYQLSRVIAAHKRDLRCLDYYNGVLVTGGSDKIFNMYTSKDGNHTKIASSDLFQKNILSVRINRRQENPKVYVLVGSADGKIHAFDVSGNPIQLFQHTKEISSIDFIDEDHFVSGSWDGKAIIWSMSQNKKISEFNEHKFAVSVFYNAQNDTVVSGSQDKALNMWNWKTGAKIKRVENAHKDIIREITKVQDLGLFVTCSNDQTIKIWSADLEEIQTLNGHAGFVFTVKAIELGSYISGGDDKTVKVWKEQKCEQSIQLPAEVWTIQYDEQGDIFVGCSDGYLRTFTRSIERRAELSTIQIYNKQVLEAASKKSGMSQQEIQKLATIAQMNAMKGKKQGEIRVFRNGQIPEAYMWQGGKWQKIGDVITESKPSGESKPRYFEGDAYFSAGEYDYIFDVDDESGVPKCIPFNDGDNALEYAEKYCKREGLTKGYVEQIRKFLLQNSSNVSRNAIKQSTKQQPMDLQSLGSTPSMSIIEFNDVKNPPALLNKLKEFNEKAEGKKLTEKQLSYIERIVTSLENSSSYHSWTLDFKQMDSIKKLLTWPKAIRFPVWDMLRAFLKHYQSQSLFSGLDAGLDIITQLSAALQQEHPEAIYTLVLKTLANIFIQNASKGGMVQHAEIIFQSLRQISKRKELTNSNYLYAMASLIYNFSIACIQKNIEKQSILLGLGELIKVRLEIESHKNEQNKQLLLQSAANILFKYHKIVRKDFQFVLQFVSKNGQGVEKDIQVLMHLQ